MVKFAYNNAQNASTGHISFKLYYEYYPEILFKNKINSHSRSCFANQLAKEMRN